MKMTAKVVPHSSIVGSSVTIHADNGLMVCQLALLQVTPPSFKFTPELWKEASQHLAHFVADAINASPELELAKEEAGR